MSEIEIRNLTKRFEAGGHTITALDDVNLNIEKGEIYGIIGMSGAGKSTLVRSINFLEVPNEGRVLIDGTDLSKLSSKELRIKRRDIGMIFQGFNLLEQKNVIDNVCFPLEISGMKKKKARERARELLATVNLSEKENSYPSQLSGGQKQRVAIARALATNPKILLCDEATSALDPQTTSSILNLVKEINAKLNITIVVITHQMSVVSEICNKVAIIEKGQVVENGFVEDVFNHPKSSAARELILRGDSEKSGGTVETLNGERKIRIVFTENSSFEPVIANMVLKFQTVVNILRADTKNVGGFAKGEMILGLPEDEQLKEDIIIYLKERGLEIEEVTGDV